MDIDDDTSGNIDITFMYWMKNSFIVVLSKFALHSKYWSQKLSKAADGSTVLTTSYRFPSSIQLISNQHHRTVSLLYVYKCKIRFDTHFKSMILNKIFYVICCIRNKAGNIVSSINSYTRK